MKYLFLILTLMTLCHATDISSSQEITLIQKPILFTSKRIQLTQEYIQKHYKIHVQNILIQPKIIVIHWTAVADLEKSFQRFQPETLLSDRKDIASASPLNVSAHFLVDRDGTIYQLMPENWMARHVIGLNYTSIGIENVGGGTTKDKTLTKKQLDANIQLIKYLQKKYSSIKYVIGHYEYRKFEKNALWLEQDTNYRTKKSDPGKLFMKNLRTALH